MVDITHRIGIRAPAAEVYRALATIDGVAGWWSADTSANATHEGAFSVRFRRDGEEIGRMEIVPTRHVRDQEVVWRVDDGPKFVSTTSTPSSPMTKRLFASTPRPTGSVRIDAKTPSASCVNSNAGAGGVAERSLDELAVFNTTLNQADLQDLYRWGRSGGTLLDRRESILLAVEADRLAREPAHGGLDPGGLDHRALGGHGADGGGLLRARSG